MLVSGDHGEFEGADGDEVVLGRYRRDGRWSPSLVDLLAGLLRGGGTLIDVGAHVGLVAIPVVARTPAVALAFEPEPGNAAYLRRNVGRHGLAGRVSVMPFALDERDGRARLALSSENSGDHRLLAPGAGTGSDAGGDTGACDGDATTARSDVHSGGLVDPARAGCTAAGVGAYAGTGAAGRVVVEVETHALDTWLAAREQGGVLARPVVMKLDTQGTEARILRGAARTLAEVDYLVTEFWPAGLVRAGDGVEALRAALGDFAWGCVLGEGRSLALVPLGEVFRSLAWIPADGSDEGFFDLLASRHPRLCL